MTVKPPRPPKMRRSDICIRFIEENMIFPDGVHAGKPVRLVEEQKEIIRLILDPVGKDEDGNDILPRRGYVSLPRKNGKTFLVACVLLTFLLGPFAVRFGQLFSTGVNLRQAALTFDMCKRIIEHSPRFSPLLHDDKSIILRQHPRNEIEYVPLGTVYRSLSSDKGGPLGTSPVFVVHDEVGLVKGTKFELFESLETGSAAQANPLTLCISTQAPGDNDWFSVHLDAAAKGDNKRNVVKLWTCPTTIDWKSEEALKVSNMLWDYMNRDELREQQKDAIEKPSRSNSFRNYHLNQRIKATEGWITNEIYDKNREEPGEIDGAEVFAGFDLSERRDITSLSCAYQVPGSDKVSIKTFNFMPLETIQQLAETDKEAYEEWAEEGLIIATPGAKVRYEYVAEFLFGLSKRFTFRKIGYDRWRFSVFEDHLLNAGFSQDWIDTTFMKVNMKFGDDKPDLPVMDTCIDITETYLDDGKLALGCDPVLRMAFDNVAIHRNTGGQRAMDKSGHNRRFDPALATSVAVLMFNRFSDKPVEEIDFTPMRLGSNRLF